MVRLAIISDVHGNKSAHRAIRDEIKHRKIDEVIELGQIHRRNVLGRSIYFAHREHPSIDTPEEARRTLDTLDAEVLVFGHEKEPFVLSLGDKQIVNVGSAGRPIAGDPRASFAILDIEEARPIEVEIVRAPYRLKKRARKHLAEHDLAALLGVPDLVPKDDKLLAPDLSGAELTVRLLARRVHRVYGVLIMPWPDDDVEHVHELRVRTRRLREALAIAGPLLRKSDRIRASRRARKLGRVLGARRSLDVFILELKTYRGRVDERALDELIAKLEREKEHATKAIAESFVRHRLIRHGLDLLAMAMRPKNETKTLAIFAGRHLTKHVENVRELLYKIDSREDVMGHHELRIALKHLRYSAEILSSAFPQALDREKTITPLKEIQDALGVLNDARELVSIIRIHADPGLTSFEQQVNQASDARFDAARDLVKATGPDILEKLENAANSMRSRT